MTGINDKGFKPSKYQEEIFEFVRHGVGNGIIKAAAGSGKTFTLIHSMRLLPETQSCLFIAFNKSIVEELTHKLSDYPNCTAKTIHSLGLLMLKRNLGHDIEVDEYKYRKYVKSHIEELITDASFKGYANGGKDRYIETVIKLVNYSRFNIAQNITEVKRVAKQYSIPLISDEASATVKCLRWGARNTETVDYTDMVWIPYELGLTPKGLQFDWIMFDECQDASLMSIELFKKCFKRGTRFLAVGDSDQTINLFAGSSLNSFDIFHSMPNTIMFSLPITYRCAKRIVRYANTVVKDIIACDDAPEGVVMDNVHVSDICDGGMVLSRTTAKLVEVYTKLLRRNVKCYIKGKDIGENLITFLNSVRQTELNRNLCADGVFARLYEAMFCERNRTMLSSGIESDDAIMSENVMQMLDSIQALYILSEGCTQKQEIIDKIKAIFLDESEGICLSTIHKAKGLECDSVYILCHNAMLGIRKEHDWEKIQERNLRYVAYTRAKTFLGFVSEDEIKPIGRAKCREGILKDVKEIETKVKNLIEGNLIEFEEFKKSLTQITITEPIRNVCDGIFNSPNTFNEKIENDYLRNFLEKKRKNI